MGSRAQEQLQTLDQLLSQENVKKACTIGIIIDATNAYYDHKEQKFVKKLKIIDDSMNISRTTVNFRYGYCTVMFFAEKIEHLPNPFAIGDIIYLRRFAFEVYNQSFQARNNPYTYCSWALLHGDILNKDFAEYQLSRIDMNLNDDKYNTMRDSVKDLRQFARRFLEKNSVILAVPAGVQPKDSDMVVQVLRKNEHGTMRVRNSKEELVVRNCPSFVDEKEIGKLRSVADIRPNEEKELEVVNNNFTSLIKLPEWTADARTYLANEAAMEIEEETEMYTELSFLNSAPLPKIEGKKFFIKCEVFSITSKAFKDAVKYYNADKNQLSDTPKDNFLPVYKLGFACQDESLRTGAKLADIWLYSFDGQGGDFVERVNLEGLNEFSSFKQEQALYERRYNQILEAESVKLTIEVLSDGKGNRAFRALNVRV